MPYDEDDLPWWKRLPPSPMQSLLGAGLSGARSLAGGLAGIGGGSPANEFLREKGAEAERAFHARSRTALDPRAGIGERLTAGLDPRNLALDPVMGTLGAVGKVPDRAKVAAAAAKAAKTAAKAAMKAQQADDIAKVRKALPPNMSVKLSDARLRDAIDEVRKRAADAGTEPVKMASPERVGPRPSATSAGSPPSPRPPVDGGGDVLNLTEDMIVPPGNPPPRAPGGSPPAPPPGGGEPIRQYAASINLEYLNNPDDFKRVLQRLADANDQFRAQRRGPIPLDDIQGLANELGMKPNDLIKRRVGEAYNAEQITAARDLLQRQRLSLGEAAERAAKNGGDGELVRFREELERFTMMQGSLSGASTEAGRALRAHQMIKGAKSEALRDRYILDLINQQGGATNIRQQARMFHDLQSSGATPEYIRRFTKAAQDSKNAGFGSKVYFVWLNGLLSSPVTQARNVIGNTGMTASDLFVERPAAALLGKTHGGEKVTFGDVGARLRGATEGAIEGITRMRPWELGQEVGERLARGQSLRGAGAAARAKRLNAQGIDPMMQKYGLEQFPDNPLGQGRVAQAVAKPTDALKAQDEFFKGIWYRASLREQLHRHARDLPRELRKTFVDKALADPEQFVPDMHLKAVTEARYGTFQTDLGAIGQKAMDLRSTLPGARYIVPFAKTPTNIAKASLERTPFAMAMPDRFIKAIRAGGVERDVAIGRMLTGSLIGGGIVSYVAGGGNAITGNPPGGKYATNERRLWLDTFQRTSARLGDIYYAYGGFEPWAMTVGMAVDIGTAIREGVVKPDDPEVQEFMGLIGTAFRDNLFNKSFMSGPSEFLEGVWGDKDIGQFAARLGASFVPTLMSHLAQVDDPVLRRAYSLRERIYNRVPGLKRQLDPVLSVWGEEIEYEKPAGPRLMSPVYRKTAKDDPVNQELLEIEKYPGSLGKSINKKALTDKQYAEYTKLARRTAHKMLTAEVKSARWKDLSVEEKKDMVGDILRLTAREAREVMMSRYPELEKD